LKLVRLRVRQKSRKAKSKETKHQQQEGANDILDQKGNWAAEKKVAKGRPGERKKYGKGEGTRPRR